MSVASFTHAQLQLLQTIDDALHAGVSCSLISREYTELTEEATMDTELTGEATMEEGDGDNYPKMRNPPPLWPQRRRRSKSDTFGFRSNVLCRLRLARSGKNRKGSFFKKKKPQQLAFSHWFFKFTARLPFCFLSFFFLNLITKQDKIKCTRWSPEEPEIWLVICTLAT